MRALIPALFAFGLLGVVPFALAHATLRILSARWDSQWLARRGARQGAERASAYEMVAGRLVRLAWCIDVAAAVSLLAVLAYVIAAARMGVLPFVRDETLVLVGFVWVVTAPALGVEILAASFTVAGRRLRQLASQA